MIQYGGTKDLFKKGLGASGLRGPEPKCKSNLIYLSLMSVDFLIRLWGSHDSIWGHKGPVQKRPRGASGL